jgi:hypothetical protein
MTLFCLYVSCHLGNIVIYEVITVGYGNTLHFILIDSYVYVLIARVSAYVCIEDIEKVN